MTEAEFLQAIANAQSGSKASAAGDEAFAKALENAQRKATGQQVDPAMQESLGSLYEGVKLHLSRQAVGGQQIASDVARWAAGEMGKPYSPYRAEVEKQRLKLEKKTKQAPLLTQMGDIAAGLAEFGAIPMPMKGGPLARMAWNAATGGALGALEPQESGVARNQAAISGGVLGGAFPEVMGRIVIPGVTMIGRGVRSMVSPGYAGARYAQSEFPGLTLPQEVGGLWSNVPRAGEMGPVPPPGYHAGVDYTVGMATGDEALRQMETMQRLKPGSKLQFARRDLENMLNIQRGVRARSLTEEEEAAAKAALNATTGPLREQAYQDINRLGLQNEMVEPLQAELTRLRNEPGVRASPEAQSLATQTERAAFGVGNPQFPEGYPGAPNPKDLYQTRKNINKSLQKTGINLSPEDVATQAARAEAMAIKSAIDQGMNFASEGSWQKYLDEYIKGIAPITEGRAFRSILDLTRNARRAPGTDIPLITPAMMRKGANDVTTQQLGRTTEDLLTPQNRRFVDEAANALSAMENAQIGVRGTSGAPTAEYGSLLTNELVNKLASSTPGGRLAVDLVTMLGQSRGSRILNEALLDPVKMQGLLKLYHQGTPPTVLDEAALKAGAYVPESIKRRFR